MGDSFETDILLLTRIFIFQSSRNFEWIMSYSRYSKELGIRSTACIEV